MDLLHLKQLLNVDVSLTHKKGSLLDGICPEAVEMLKDQHFAANLGSVLRKMKPTRQVECVELMLTANDLTVAYAEALLAATPPHLLVSERRPRKPSGVTAEQMVKMEHETGNLQGQLKLVENSCGQDVLLVLARGYLDKRLDDKAVFRFLSQRQPDMLAAFEDIIQTVALDGK
ncbi:plasmid partitioning protein RepB C-terminal domain-containing protein [Verminephrobacter eiseniae]|uniref:plasmid partitioning protein RepB C-terminal domain-containing protein n=1 Tax=Verminephrobacter eiseniae TaxID=364317 RepID=UPI002237A39A|nr:plasmid partitioning protein RepB C-terminal domain-containing protein [Verminephrobacter eiseniae]